MNEEVDDPKMTENDPPYMSLVKDISTLKVELATVKTDVAWIKRWFAPTVLLALLSMLVNLALVLLRK